MDLGSVRVALDEYIREVDDALVDYLEKKREPVEHYEMIRYHLGFANAAPGGTPGPRLPRGKRLRAVACLLISRAIGAPADATRTLMIAGEMMHAASLVHDDIQDKELLRWNRPTVWAAFGTDQAINVGDAMIGMTYELLLALRDVGVEASLVLQTISTFNEAHLRMSEGQHLDLAHAGRFDIPLEKYFEMASLKTGAACECIAYASALVSGCAPRVAEAYRGFGRSFGLLYQLCDDIRDVTDDLESTGKAGLKDLRRRKPTLPLLLGVAAGAPTLTSLLRRESAEELELTRDEELAIRAELRSLGVDARCRSTAATKRDEALHHLAETGLSGAEHAQLEMMVRLCAQAAGVDA